MNIASVSWADHLIFGDGDGRLDTPEKLERRMRVWREELGAGVVHWRMLRARIDGCFHAAPGYEHPSRAAARAITWDDLTVVPAIAHAHGLEAWLYVSLFDEGWPLASADERAHSHHNAMHGQHVSWQSELTRAHEEWLATDRTGTRRQSGVVSLSYPEARRAFIDRWLGLLDRTVFDGLFICLRSQSRPPDHADEFGFNAPARADYARRHPTSNLGTGTGRLKPAATYTAGESLSHGPAEAGPYVREQTWNFRQWRDLLGEYLTELTGEVRAALDTRAGNGRRMRLGVGTARGDVLGPPLGNTALQWREWVRRGLVDHLVIDQNSSQCPSMWHPLWPMHRGTGYVQNYLDGSGMPPLADHLRETYAPVVNGSGTQLFVARQWHERDSHTERALHEIPGVSGLVFSTFRHDNGAAIARGNWTAGRLRYVAAGFSWPTIARYNRSGRLTCPP